MNKSQLIEKISRHFGIQDSDQKLFFEIFLRKCSETLDSGQFIQVAEIGEIGKFEDRNALNKETTFKIAVIVNQDEFLFDIPEEDKEVQSIDSYFSISIGKPVIPLKENDDSEFFIPHSGDEMKRMFELKIERFIEDAKKQQNELEEESELDFSDNLSDVDFSFENWKSSSNEDKELTQEKIDEEEKAETNIPGIQTEENNLTGEANVEDNNRGQTESDLIEKTSDEISKEIESQLEEIIPETEEIPHAVEEITEEIKIEEIIEDEKTEDELNPEVEETVSSEIVEEELPDEQVEETEKELVNSDDTFDKEKLEGNKKAEAKDTGLKEKKSYGGFIFAIAALVIIAVVIYFYYYSVNTNQNVVQQNNIPKQFAVTIDRTYDIPVTYPYTKGMLGEPHNAINVGILSGSGKEEIAAATNNNETISSGSENSGKIEIREPLPARRVKGYIYKYKNMYAVQVSSWKSKSIALSEGQKYLDAGYDAFIEQTKLNDKGVYYRVRVGGFSTLEEAKNFSKK